MYSMVPTITYIFVREQYCMKVLLNKTIDDDGAEISIYLDGPRAQFNEAHMLFIQGG